VIEPAPAAAAAASSSRVDSAPVAAAPAAKTAPAPVGKARGKDAAPAHGRARVPNRNRSGTRVDSSAGQGELASPTGTEAGTGEPKEAPAPRVAAPKRAANWIDPFAE